MRLRIWGCRGSLPAPGPHTVVYGGNTSCVEVQTDDESALVLDAGTGIRALGLDLVRRGTLRIDLFLTHLHLDHLEGLRFFAPLWDERVTIDIWGPRSPLIGLRERILRGFSPPLFPIDFRDVPAQVSFHDLPASPGGARASRSSPTSCSIPGPTVGFRLEADGRSVAYLPDHEPALAGIEGRSIDWISAADLAHRADVVAPRRAVPRRGVRLADRLGALERRRRRGLLPCGRGGPPRALPPRSRPGRQRARGPARSRRGADRRRPAGAGARPRGYADRRPSL